MQIGILGGGQLARMLILAGTPLGIKFKIYSSSVDEPTAGLCEIMTGSYEDPSLLTKFAKSLDCITFEFENISTNAVEILSKQTCVFPSSKALEIGQDRAKEKELFTKLKIPTTNYKIVTDKSGLPTAINAIGIPCVVKTTRLGYDGKGQTVINAQSEIDTKINNLGSGPFIVENKINFQREISVIAVRGTNNQTRFYPLVENTHSDGILIKSVAPAPKSEGTVLEAKAYDYATRILDELEYRGVLAIEFFVEDNELIANEIAPRVHNSGHWSIEGAEISQFENHIRAVAGLPLGSTQSVGLTTMYNIIGEVPETTYLLKQDNIHLHLYGKTPRSGRKLGHYTVVASKSASLSQ